MSTALTLAERDEIHTVLRSALADPAAGTAIDVLDSFGWTELLASDPIAAVTVVFGVLGETGATAAILGDVVRHGIGDAVLDGGVVLDGGAVLGSRLETQPAVVLSWSGDADARSGRRRTDGIWVDGVCPEDPTGRPLLVAVDDGDTSLAVVASIDAPPRRIGGFDPDLGLWSVVGWASRFAPLGADAVGPWRHAVDLARLALAAQLDGLATASLDLAVDHVTQREQFGRPVGSFQAVQHRLAEVFVALEAGRAAIAAAVECPDRVATLAAKSMTGRASAAAGSGCLQALGGIGFTADHPLHRYLKRGIVLDRLLGGARDLPAALGAELIATGSVPSLVEL